MGNLLTRRNLIVGTVVGGGLLAAGRTNRTGTGGFFAPTGPLEVPSGETVTIASDSSESYTAINWEQGGTINWESGGSLQLENTA